MKRVIFSVQYCLALGKCVFIVVKCGIIYGPRYKSAMVCVCAAVNSDGNCSRSIMSMATHTHKHTRTQTDSIINHMLIFRFCLFTHSLCNSKWVLHIFHPLSLLLYLQKEHVWNTGTKIVSQMKWDWREFGGVNKQHLNEHRTGFFLPCFL